MEARKAKNSSAKSFAPPALQEKSQAPLVSQNDPAPLKRRSTADLARKSDRPVHPLVKGDPYLSAYETELFERQKRTELLTAGLLSWCKVKSILEVATWHTYLGLHASGDDWVIREWLPNAQAVFLIGDHSQWKPSDRFRFTALEDGIWQLKISKSLFPLHSLYRLFVQWPGGSGERVPAFATRVVQDEQSKIFSAQVWSSSVSPQPLKAPTDEAPLIYEAHVGMAGEEARIHTYKEFSDLILPRIKAAGYNTVQLMAIQEHPYYGSFGYQVSSFFAPSSRFGTPDDLKQLINHAHELGLRVIMDIVHSHAVKNEIEGLSAYDGTSWQFFHEGPRGHHPAWDTRCFNYTKYEVIRFLLSNCRYWIEDFGFDGFRFDGVTSMLYWDHGLGKAFTSYDDYFSFNVDLDALSYLQLANELIHTLLPRAITIAEDVSGMPGLAAPSIKGGTDFNYRLAMGTPDYWIKLLKEKRDEEWDVGNIFWELTNRRQDEKTVSYCESHDQALVGDKTLMFRLADAEMYTHMQLTDTSVIIDRAVAIHKLLRLITAATAQSGYLNFMGNEFGHPEWIDFPREGNGWSCHYARRQWSLFDNSNLKYHQLGQFDRVMIQFIRDNSLLSAAIHHQYQHISHQVIAFTRGEFLFVFNFSPAQSFEGYELPASGRSYEVALCTDSKQFGGFGRVDEKVTFPVMAEKVKVYLPSRSALVLRKK